MERVMKDTKAFLREFNEYWVREDTQAILDTVTDDICFGMAGGKRVTGKADFAEFLNQMTGSGNTDMGLDITNVIVDGDRAVVNGEISMAGDKGQRRTYAFCDVYRLAGGRVAALTAYVLEVKGDEEQG
jgi:ketosteroid isomerase-like protein